MNANVKDRVDLQGEGMERGNDGSVYVWMGGGWVDWREERGETEGFREGMGAWNGRSGGGGTN